jgi:hypothetical protein
MKRSLLLTLSIVLLINSTSFCQTKTENKKKFFEAEGFVLFEEYEDALPLYLQLIKSYPSNANLKYRIGQCYINTPGEKDKAVAYLEEAISDINPKYREGRFRENGAPHDAYYYLSNAYRINNQLDKAIETYEIFNRNLDTKVYNPEVVQLQIVSCQNAIDLMKTPVYIRKQNLGPVINDQYPDLNPVLAGDQMSMVYNKRTPFQQALLYSRKISGSWSEPVNIIPDLGLGQEEGNFATSLSADGNELYIYRRGTDYDGNIYVTKRINNERWGNIVRLNDNINTKYWESHAAISYDGKKLFFTSNRKGSIGGLDIYVSERDSADAWGPAINLGTSINTIYNEDTPFLSRDGRTLFFSSEGHYNMGGYDIFYSTLQPDGKWSEPKNAGYPVNTTDDDLFFHPVNEGYQAYYSLIDDDGYGLADIYSLEIFSDKNPRTFTVRGNVKVDDLRPEEEDSIKVTATSLTHPGKTAATYSDPLTGDYEFRTYHGDHKLNFEAPFIDTKTFDIRIPLNSPDDVYPVPSLVLDKTDFTALLEVGDAQIKGDSITYVLKTEPRSTIRVERWAGDSLLSVENFVITDNIFTYRMTAGDITDTLKFTLTDRYGNITTVNVPVEKPVARKRPSRPSDYTRITERKDITELLPVREDTTGPAPETETGTVIPEPREPVEEEGRCRLWYLWLLLGIGIIFFLFLWRRRKNENSGKS